MRLRTLTHALTQLKNLTPRQLYFYGVVHQQVHQSHMNNIDEVKQCLLNLWHGMDRGTTDNAIDDYC